MTSTSIEERIVRARDAQRSWGALSTVERSKAIARFRRTIGAERERIVEAIVSDTGKPQLDALSGDVLVTLEQMLFYERRAARILRPRRAGKSLLFYRGTSFQEQFEPYGVALVYGPANYPFQLALVPAITALYAGNAVVLKVSDRTPTVAPLIEELWQLSGLPADLMQTVCDEPKQAGEYIDARPDLVFFTGSSANGREVARRAAAHLIPVVLELGGKDPAIVFADCNFERTIEGVTYGAFSNAGQVCIGIKRLYIEEPLYELFRERLVQRACELRVGAGRDCDLGTLQSVEARQLLTAQIKDALECGAILETPAPSGLYGDGPILLTRVPPEGRLLREETFGPVLCVASFSNESEAIRLANETPFALGASIWTNDSARAHRVARAVNAGSCAINDVIRNIGNPEAAFGGNAASGYGRYRGSHGLLTFSRLKTVMTARSRRRREINWFPFTTEVYNSLHAVLELRHRPNGVLQALRRLLSPVLLLVLACHTVTLTAGSKGHLWLKVDVPSGTHGVLAYLVFNSPAGFPQNAKKAITRGFSPDTHPGKVNRIDLGEFPPGRYSISVYLDENGNRKLDSNWLGIPKEPVGASNNPRPRSGPPRFEDCAFQMGASDQTISIRLEMPR